MSKQCRPFKGQILAIINTLDPLELEHLQKLRLSVAEIERMKVDDDGKSDEKESLSGFFK
jgi:hypothetical protein